MLIVPKRLVIISHKPCDLRKYLKQIPDILYLRKVKCCTVINNFGKQNSWADDVSHITFIYYIQQYDIYSH